MDRGSEAFERTMIGAPLTKASPMLAVPPQSSSSMMLFWIRSALNLSLGQINPQPITARIDTNLARQTRIRTWVDRESKHLKFIYRRSRQAIYPFRFHIDMAGPTRGGSKTFTDYTRHIVMRGRLHDGITYRQINNGFVTGG